MGRQLAFLITLAALVGCQGGDSAAPAPSAQDTASKGMVTPPRTPVFNPKAIASQPGSKGGQ